MDETGAVDGGDRAAQLAADERRLARAERPLRLEDGLERPPLDELHPQADAPVVLFGAVDRDDAGWRTRARTRPSWRMRAVSWVVDVPWLARSSFSATSR